MPVLYEPYQSHLATKENKKLFYPRVVIVGNVSTDQLAEEVARYSSLTPGDVKNTIDNLVTVMTTHLQASESVKLNGLGSFRMLMHAQGKGVESNEEVSAKQATLRVCFRPSSTRNLDGSTATRSFITGAKCKRFDRATGSIADQEEEAGGSTGSDNNDNEQTGGGI